MAPKPKLSFDRELDSLLPDYNDLIREQSYPKSMIYYLRESLTKNTLSSALTRTR
ncbi:conserved hypothetical protein [Aspergillus fumigatus A1163]|uniref:Uncharacterized protein n=1 Tax=Aspergillus fumigatus (strain CBS 144.89 / FGSC A1163 / CEA10) TaxID=451804 RepID=B0Y030_ASPFC|nr:conserved hypothetical protein [Aspergillus fumigatus A1163]